jgi:hypothetical protein
MRNIRKLLLLAVGVSAAMAFVPSAASAQVELEREQGGDCPTVVTVVNHRPSDTGCSIHAITEPGTTADLFQHTGVSEVGFSQCTNEFEAAFDRNGHGFIYNQVLQPEGVPCGREPCDEAEPSTNPHRNLAWEAQIGEPLPPMSQESLTVTFCLYAHNPAVGSEGTVGTNCTVNLSVSRVEHQYEVETGNGVEHTSPCTNLGGVVELEGHWITTPATPRHRGFIVHHLTN